MTMPGVPHDQPEHGDRRRIPAGIVLVVVATALLAGLLLNAADILRTAQRQEPGWQRTVGVTLMQPIARVSEMLLLDRPRSAIDTLLGRAPSEPQAVPSPTTTAPGSTTSTTPPVGSSTTSVAPEAAPRRTVTRQEPLILYIGGDSMVGQFGPMLDDRAAESGMVEAEVVYEFESGLSRPDFVDWPQRLARVSEDLDPDAFVLYFGGNDAQAIYREEGPWIEYGTPEWEREYRARVDEVMTLLEDRGHWVYWMGMPVVRSESFQERVRLMNEIYRDEAEDHPLVTFVEAWSVFEGPDGGFSEYLTDADGNLVDMRLDDGVHYTTAGAVRLAEVTYRVIADDWNLP
ncbi:MAG: DUF459 domain-containing protein [Actinomycetota bacterium]